jgi:cell division protein FtsB
MAKPRKSRPLFSLFFVVGILTLAGYFTFAAMQGEYGLFERIELEAQRAELQAQYDLLAAEMAAMENLTLRLSDDYLDPDLLDERARRVLGLVRSDEIVIQ